MLQARRLMGQVQMSLLILMAMELEKKKTPAMQMGTTPSMLKDLPLQWEMESEALLTGLAGMSMARARSCKLEVGQMEMMAEMETTMRREGMTMSP